MARRQPQKMSSLDYHVLLSLASGPLYGYAIKDSVETESSGTLTPRAGSLYRVLARLMSRGLVAETDPEQSETPNPGLARRYYRLTDEGRVALGAEAHRLKEAAAMAEERLGIARGRS